MFLKNFIFKTDFSYLNPTGLDMFYIVICEYCFNIRQGNTILSLSRDISKASYHK